MNKLESTIWPWQRKKHNTKMFSLYRWNVDMSAIITATEDCKAKAPDHRQRRSQRKPLTVLEASEIYAYMYKG